MFKLLFDLIAESYPITSNTDIDQVLYLFIGIIAFAVAFDIVGTIFDFIGYYDSKLMSEAHWSIRLGVFVGLSWILKKIFEFIAWLFSFPLWVYLIIATTLVTVIFLIYYLKYRSRKATSEVSEKKVEVSKAVDPKINSSDVIEEDTRYTRTRCPRCGGELQQRYGPYGSFWGCSNYRGNEFRSCKYTRRFL